MFSLFKIQKVLVLIFCAVFVASANVYNSLRQGFGQTGDFPKQQGLKFVDVTPELIELLSKCYKEVGLNEKGKYKFSFASGASFVSALFALVFFVFISRMMIILHGVSFGDVARCIRVLFMDDQLFCRRISDLCFFSILILFFFSILIYIDFFWLGYLDSKHYCNAELKRIFGKRLNAFIKQLFAQQQSGACINVQNGPLGALLNWILCVDIPLELREKVFAQRFAQISNSCEFSNVIAAALKAKA